MASVCEAFSRGDRTWVRRRFRMNLNITIGIDPWHWRLPLVFLADGLFGKWAGSAAVPSRGPSAFGWESGGSYLQRDELPILCAAASGRVKIQMIYSIAASIVNLILSIVLVQKLGLTGVIIGTVGAFSDLRGGSTVD